MGDSQVTREYIQGILAAQQCVALVTGKHRLEGMTDREWALISELHLQLAELSSRAARRVT
jgi:hypothetical protein